MKAHLRVLKLSFTSIRYVKLFFLIPFYFVINM